MHVLEGEIHGRDPDSGKPGPDEQRFRRAPSLLVGSMHSHPRQDGVVVVAPQDPGKRRVQFRVIAEHLIGDLGPADEVLHPPDEEVAVGRGSAVQVADSVPDQHIRNVVKARGLAEKRHHSQKMDIRQGSRPRDEIPALEKAVPAEDRDADEGEDPAFRAQASK